MSKAAPHIVKILEDRAMELVESFGNFPDETKVMNPNVWKHILAYVPTEALQEKLAKRTAQESN